MNLLPGLYLTMLPDGKLKRELLTKDGQTTLATETTIKDEIIFFSELIFGPYSAVVDLILYYIATITEDGDPNFGGINLETFQNIQATVEDLTSTLEEENPLHGTLLRTELEDWLPFRAQAPDQIMRYCAVLAGVLERPMQFQFALNHVLDDLENKVPLDWEMTYSPMREMYTYQVLRYEEPLAVRQVFRSLVDYYQFLLLHFASTKPIVCHCQCCGRFFVPKTKKKTLYCDREFKNGRTCKQVAPKMKHKIEVQNQTIIEEFDRAKQRMYKRYERTLNLNQKPTPKTLTYNEYYAWLEPATQARDACVRGELPPEEARKIINVE